MTENVKDTEMEFLTRNEAANLLRVSPRTLTNWMKRKLIPYFKMGDSKQADVRFRKVDIVAKLNKIARVN